jgi:thiamine biosynthesis protein ThiI
MQPEVTVELEISGETLFVVTDRHRGLGGYPVGSLDPLLSLMSGECVAQVSSQTLRNLSVIDRVTDRLVLRPVIATDKEDIMQIAEQIGTAVFAANMPEYCGVISVRPATRAKRNRAEARERYFDMKVLSVPLAHGTIIDIRHPDEEEITPLKLHVPVLKIPF